MTIQTGLALLLWCLFCGALLGNKEDIEDMFALAQHVHSMGTKNNTAEMASLVYADPLRSMQLIRVPKASSTSLSVVARRMVGCSPPGPCCRFPGDPVWYVIHTYSMAPCVLSQFRAHGSELSSRLSANDVGPNIVVVNTLKNVT